MEQIKFYINPDIFMAEHKDQASKNDYDHVNVDFEKQSKIGRATGKAWLPKEVKEAISKARSKLASKDVKHIDINDLPKTNKEEDVLG